MAWLWGMTFIWWFSSNEFLLLFGCLVHLWVTCPYLVIPTTQTELSAHADTCRTVFLTNTVLLAADKERIIIMVTSHSKQREKEFSLNRREETLPVSVLCFCWCSWGRWHSFRGCICSHLGKVRCRQSWHREWECSPAPELCHCKRNRRRLWAVKVAASQENLTCRLWQKRGIKNAGFCHLRRLKVTDYSTCEELSPLLDWAWCCWRPSPSCWPAGLPRPLSCGCSSLEEFLPRGSWETHLLLERGTAWGYKDPILLIINNTSVLNISFLAKCAYFSFIEPVTHVTQSKRFSRAAMCRGESPWMLTACRSQRAFSSSSAISTLPENAAQWRQMFSS